MTLFLTDTEREQLRADLERAEHLAREHARILAGCRAALAGPPVDMLADQLAAFRTADGGVAYEAEEARWVVKGDWIQACHGDEGNWQEVVSTVHADGQTGLVTMTDDGTRLRWWAHTDTVRVARPAADVVAGQERHR